MKAILKKVIRKITSGCTEASTLARMMLYHHSMPDLSWAVSFLQQLSPNSGQCCWADNNFKYQDRSRMVSVIVPAYNVEKYIDNCLESILRQQVSFDFEVIVVNDGSTDSTPVLLEKYGQNDRIRIIHQKNAGLSAARNTGMAYSKGEFLCFVDSDDELLAGALEQMMAVALQKKAKLVVGSYETCIRNGKTQYTMPLEDKKADVHSLPGFAWGKVIHYSVFENLKFPEGYWFEDSVMAQIVHPMCRDAIYTVSNVSYRYYFNEAGITATARSKPKALDSLWITMRLLEDRKKYHLSYSQFSYEHFLSMVSLTYRRTRHLGAHAAQCIFVVQKMLLDRYYCDYQIKDNPKKLRIEQALRENNFRKYVLACMLKRETRQHHYAVTHTVDGACERYTMKAINITLSHKTILITGAAGFIGSNLALKLLETVPGVHALGIDNCNDYYDVALKEYRLKEIDRLAAAHTDRRWTFIQGNIADKGFMDRLFSEHRPDVVVNLAAQAGVRYSIDHPDAYMESNVIGFYNLLEACRHYPVEHLVYASSSSVYGSNKKVPYSTEDKVDNPVSLYAATKKSNELMAHAYAKLYEIPVTGLRFFTVYGPAGRPDMAYFGFTDKLLRGQTVQIFNYGNCQRDFTYIDDVVEGVIRVMQRAPEKCTGEDGLPIPAYAIYNIGNSNPENLMDFVQILSEELVRAGVLSEDYDFASHMQLVPMQPGDVPVTYADTKALEEDVGFRPHTTLRDGLRSFAQWYQAFYME